MVSINQISWMETPIVDLQIDTFKESGFTFDDGFNERDHGLQTTGCKYLDEEELLNMIQATLWTKETLKNIRLHSNTSIHANRTFPKDILKRSKGLSTMS